MKPDPAASRGVFVAIAVVVVANCGPRVYQPSAASSFALDRDAEINDEDIRKAFEAAPQMAAKPRVAFFTFDEQHPADVERILRATPGVADVYHIGGLFVTGAHRFDEDIPWRRTREPFSLKKARLMAARAHCDVLVLFDYGRRLQRRGNVLAAFGVLILPTLFLPMFDADVSSALDTYVIDVRNGYLYGQLTSEQQGHLDYLTLYSTQDDSMAEAQWPRLLQETQGPLGQVLNGQASRIAP
jgi:hypothetical protein